MNKQIFFLLAFLLCLNLSFAQYGWTDAEVYLKNGKTLIGEAKIPMMSAALNLKKEQLKYKKDKKGKKSKYKPQEIDSIVFTIHYTERVNKKKVEKTRVETYIPVFLNKKKTKQGFVEVLVEGKLRLVGRTVMVQSGGMWVPGPGVNAAPVYQPGFMGSHNQVMFLREGEKPVVFNQANILKSFRKRAMEYFEDCPSLRSKLDNKEFKMKDLQEIVRYYNSNCL